MTTLAQDNFDSDAVGSIAPGWVAIKGTWVVRASGSVSGANCFACSSAADADAVLYTGVAAVADEDFNFSVKQSTTTTPPMGIILRSDSGNANCYALLFAPISGGNLGVDLYKKVSGAYSQVGSRATMPLSPAVGDVVKIRATAIGSTISIYAGVSVLPTSASATFTDASISAAGFPGLYYSPTVGSQGIDDMVYANTAVPADTTPPTFVSAMVSSSSPSIVQVTMSEALAASVPPNSAWSVTGSSTGTQTANGTTISGAVAQVSFPNAFVAGETITVTYTAPGSNPRLQDQAATPNIAVSFGPVAVSNNTSAPVNNALSGSTASVLFSPSSWDVQASTAKTINAGSAFRTVFGGTACTLAFDLTNIADPKPQLWYRIDGYGPWTKVTLASSIVLAVPSDTAAFATKPGHLLEVIVKSTTESQPRWSTQATAVKLTGIFLDSGMVISSPGGRPLKGLFYGDSITEGVRNVKAISSPDTDTNDAAMGWAYNAAQILGAEAGIVGFGGSGLITSGSGGVPALTGSYNFLYSGVARSFAGLDFIVLMEGTNDSGDVTAAATTVLNGLIAASTAKIIVLRPFNGTAHAGQLQAAIAACSTPSRCTYVDTAGFFNSANSSDALHPYGVENITHIAPAVAAAIRPILIGVASSPTLIARTVTFQLATGTNADGTPIYAANLTGAKIAFYDEASPDLHTVARYRTASGTFNSTGTCTFVAQSTLAAGATGSVVVWIGSNRYTSSVVVA